MIETDIRLLEPGPGLCMDVRVARVTASDDSPDLLWKACGALQGMGLAAVRRPGTSELIVATSRTVPGFDRSGDNWRYDVEDLGKGTRLRYKRPTDRKLLVQLTERLLPMQVQRRTDLWRLGDSRTIWYEREPFVVKDGVAAYRRYEISGQSLGDTGVGIAVNIGTAFLTTWTVADFFAENVDPHEQKRRKRRFDSLSARQQGQKGTLLYDAGESLHKCYFEDFRHGIACATTGAFRVQGQDYDSLLHYYQRRHPEMDVEPDDPVAYVSFGNIDRPQPVAANRLRLRVSNESLPARLRQVDKIPPEQRRSYAEGFWERLGEEPLGPKRPRVAANFWRPKNNRLLWIQAPELAFGDSQILPAPRNASLKERTAHFRERSRILERAGCFAVPLMVTRVVHVAVPKRIGVATGARLAEDLADRLSSWTRKPVRYELVMYEDVADAVSQLRAEPNSGVVVFVIDDSGPEIYYDVAYELRDWRVKRITGDTLVGMFSKLELDAHDSRASGNGKNGRAPSCRHWDSFVEKNALEVLQHMDCVPYLPAEGLNYEAQLAIDVGHDRRYFSLSLLVRRQDSLKPQFRLETVTKSKPDHKQEAINHVILREEIVALF